MWIAVSRSPGARGLLGLVLFAGLTAGAPPRAAIWPSQLGGYSKAASQSIALSGRALWDEYGLEQTEGAEYVSGARRFEAAAYRLKDSTGAYGAFEWQRPPDARPSKLGALAAESKDGVWLAHGNYVFYFAGWKPKPADLAPFLDGLPELDRSPLPTTRNFMPTSGLVPNSERYVIGPVGLQQFDPGIPASVAAFPLGVEAQMAQYQSKSGPLEMGVFSYPTPQMAIQRVAEFQKLPGAVARRSGPLVAVILSPHDGEAAEKLVSSVKYNAIITWNERVPTRRDNVGEMILNIFILAGILIGLFAVAGLVFGFLRLWLRWGREEEPMILLHLQDR